ncbi:MAG: TRAP transporter small permease subunit [Gammaproteobacteria bacterium]
MPELSFVLPHWLYWGGLIVFPLFALFMVRRAEQRRSLPNAEQGPVSLLVAYLFLLVGGFVGCHRLYLKSYWALAFIALFTAVLLVNVEARNARDNVSNAHGAYTMTESRLARAERSLEKAERRLQRRDSDRNRKRVDSEREKITDARKQMDVRKIEWDEAEAVAHDWNTLSRNLGLAILALLIVDALLLPSLVRRRNALEKGEPTEPGFVCPAVEEEVDVSREKFLFNRVVGRINGFAGEVAAYWSVIAVFVYYYEVIARYVFNSPTNWAHEAMFLMFGMQYLLAGGYALREGAHVRVDVIYTNLSTRTKAILDLITSVAFFIFVTTLLVTGWIFFHDALEIQEVSFTEWGIQYYPIKFALPLGAALLMLQGIAQLLNDIDTVLHPPPDDPDTNANELRLAIEEGHHGT